MTPETSSQPSRATPVTWEFVALSLVVVFVAAVRFGATVVDRDLWGRIRFGLDRLEAGKYFYSDMYSYLTEGQRVFDHDWLTANSMAFLYQWLGTVGLSVVKASLALGLIAFFCFWMFRSGLRAVWMATIGLISVLALTPTLGTFRPQVLTTILFTGLLVIMVLVQGGNRRVLFAVPPLFLLWINLHGGVLAGVAVAGVWATLFAVTERGRTRLAPLASWIVGLLVLGINPNGYEHVAFLLRTTLVDRPEILDWLPIELQSPQGLAYVAVALLLLLGVVKAGMLRTWPLDIPMFVLMAAPLIAARHLQLFVPAVVVLGSSYIAPLSFTLDRESSNAETRSQSRFWKAISATALLSTAVSLTSSLGCMEVEANQFDFPARALSAIEGGLTGNAIVPFNWGEYVIWYRGTDLLVSTDGRRETAYSDEVHQMNLDFVNGTDDWDRLLGAAPADLILLPSNAPGAILMESNPGWDLAYDDGFARIFLPVGSSLSLEPISSLPVNGDGVCFPETAT